LLDKSKQQINGIKPKQLMLRYLVFGFATFCSQNFELAEFAAPDYAGDSIRLLRDPIKSLQSMKDFKIQAPNVCNRKIVASGAWDLKNKLQKAVDKLKLNDWGLNYDEFKPSFSTNRVDRKVEQSSEQA
jgi:hypothetical protein